MQKILSLCVVTLACLVATPSYAQYKLDIKTPTGEKYDLQIIKKGVIKLTERSSWATEEEIGEDYSVWLHDLQRMHRGDSLYIRMKVSLRTPAMLTRGRPIDGRAVWLRYHWEEVQQIAKDSLSAETIQMEDELGAREVANVLKTMYGAVSMAAGSPTMGMEASLVSSLAEPIIGGFTEMLQREPSPVEVFESIYLAQHVLAAVEEMVKEQAGR